MTPKQLLIRLVLITICAIAASICHAISAVWWSAAICGFSLALGFTIISERVLRQKLFGKIGNGLISFFSVHLLGETLTLAALLALYSFCFGIGIENHLAFGIAAGVTWLILCHEALGKIVSLTALYIATRR